VRLLFTSLGSFGHTFPLVPLAVAARDAGHDVVFATSEDFLPQLTKAGLETAAAGLGLREGFQQAFGAQGDTGPRRPPGDIPREVLYPIIAKVFGDVMPRRFLADLVPLIEELRPDLVVYESGNSGGGFAAARAGVPALRRDEQPRIRVQCVSEQLFVQPQVIGVRGVEEGDAELGRPARDRLGAGSHVVPFGEPHGTETQPPHGKAVFEGVGRGHAGSFAAAPATHQRFSLS